MSKTATTLFTIPVCKEGQMSFIKRSTGDEVYIRFNSQRPDSKNYDVVLTDTIPVYSEDGIVPGDVNVASDDGLGVVSGYASFT